MERDSKGRFKSPEQKVYAEGYKGFFEGFLCRKKHYKIGQVATAKAAQLCKKGLHFCKNPIDVLHYYAPHTGIYAKVQALDYVLYGPDDPAIFDLGDSKRVTKKLKVIKELSLKDLLDVFLGSLKHVTGSAVNIENGLADVPWGNIMVRTNYSGAVVNSGKNVAVCTNDHSGAKACGIRSVAVTSDDHSIAAGCGICNVAVAVGGWSAAIANGPHSIAVLNGSGGRAVAEGTNSIAIAGHQALCTAEAKVPHAVAMATFSGQFVRGVKGSILLFPVWEYPEGAQLSRDKVITSYVSTVVDGEKIKENTWYIYKNNQWVPYDKIQ